MSLNPPSYPKEPVKKDIVINNNSKVEIPFSSKVPSINRLFLSKSSEFCAKLQKYLKFENDKRTNSIINSVLSKYLAPLLNETYRYFNEVKTDSIRNLRAMVKFIYQVE